MTRCTIPCACHAQRHPNVQKCSVPVIFFALLTCKCASRHNGVHFFDISTSNKWSEHGVFFYILTSKCASRHNGVHFFDITTSKGAPNVLLCTFWLRNVLRATTACTFPTSQLPKVVRDRHDFEIHFAPQKACNFSSLIWPDGSAPAALASLLFDPPESQITGKT